MPEENFGFTQLPEEQEEQLDFAKQIPCPHCKKSIPRNSTMCLYCGEEVSHRSKPSRRRQNCF